METKEIKVNVEKESKEIGVAIAKLLETSSAAMADGFQAGQDIPTVLMGSYKELSEAIDGADKVGAAFKKDPIAVIEGMLLPILEAVQVIRKKAASGVIESNKVTVKK